MHEPLSNSVRVYADLRDRLIAEFDLAEEDPVLLDTLEGATDLQERLVLLAREAKKAEAFAEAVKAIIADNRSRKERFERKSEKLRELIAWAMEESGLRKIEAPDMTLSERIGLPSIVTTIEPADAPEHLVVTKIEKRFDTKKLREALASGVQFDWAHFGNAAPSLTIRSK